MGIYNERKILETDKNKCHDKQINKDKLDNLKSRYNLYNILSYLNVNSKLKLFAYSKRYQKELNITKNNYREKYFEQKGINLVNIYDYFSLFKENKYDFMEKGGYPAFYSKNYLPKKYEIYKNKFSNNIISDYISYCIEQKNLIDNAYLDIYSPFFEALSTNNYFSDKFTIIVSIKFIKDNNLENDYIQAFNNLNKFNSNYSILFRFINPNDIDYLVKFKMNLKNIKKLILLEDKDIGKYNYFFEKFFSFNEIKSNLRHLKISLKFNIDNRLLQDINNFKKIEILELNNIYFKSLFILDLLQLKILNISKCENISLSPKMSSNLIDLYFDNFTPIQERQLKFPNLKKCVFNFEKFYINYNLIFDFITMKNLKVLKSESEDFLKLRNNITLEDLTVISNHNNSIEIEKKIIEKIISMKSLKIVNILLNKIGYNDISLIDGLNNSITSFKIELKNQPNYDLYNLQEKLPNLSNLEVKILSENIVTDIDITENMQFNIKNLKIICHNATLKLYCHSFKNLEKIDITIVGDLKNFKDKFPFFKDNCDIIFSSLNYFKFSYSNNIDLKIFDNLCHNLGKMNNLKYLCLCFVCENIDKNYYDLLNEKLSNLKLDYINIDISNGLIIPELWNDGQYEEAKIINEFKENGIYIKKLN